MQSTGLYSDNQTKSQEKVHKQTRTNSKPLT